MSASAIGYLRIASTDPAAWTNWGTSVLGLMEAPREDAANARFLRMDDHPFRFMIEPEEADKLLAAGLEFPNEAAWQNTLDALIGAGHKVEPGSDEQAQRRCVRAFATVDDPAGNTLELYYGRQLDYSPFVSQPLYLVLLQVMRKRATLALATLFCPPRISIQPLSSIPT